MLHWKLKSCSRCGGDLFVDRDADGWFEQCLQCSHRRELRDVQQTDWCRWGAGIKKIGVRKAIEGCNVKKTSEKRSFIFNRRNGFDGKTKGFPFFMLL